MNPMFDKHQWRLILRALRERRGHEMCGTKWYQEYSEFLLSLRQDIYGNKYSQQALEGYEKEQGVSFISYLFPLEDLVEENWRKWANEWFVEDFPKFVESWYYDLKTRSALDKVGFEKVVGIGFEK